MRIDLRKLTLLNFKGVKNTTIEFDKITNIYGANRSGKTTLFDAFIWVLFGKNSQGAADFNIKTLDDSGEAIHQMDHSVTATLDVDGSEIVLQRTFKEKWTRRRGSEETELTGHETLFFVNDVPLQAGEYKAKISEMVDEGLFKLVTSSTAFNSMPWQKRREVLIQIAGEITNADVMKGMNKTQVKDLTEILNSGKDLAEFKKEIAMRKKKLADELKGITPRIDEVKRAIPEAVDFEAVKKEIYASQSALLEIENAITDKVAAYEEQAKLVQEKRKTINTIKTKLQQIEFEAKKGIQQAANDREMKLNELKLKGKTAVQFLKDCQAEANSIIDRKANTEQAITALRAKWHDVSSQTIEFKEGEFICPTCKQSLPAETINTRQEMMTADFEANKTKQLAEIKSEGERLNALIVRLDSDAATCSTQIDTLTGQIDELATQVREIESHTVTQDEVELGVEYYATKKEIDTLELSVLETPSIDITGLKQQKGSISIEIDRLKSVLSSEDQIKKGNARVKELLAEEKSLAGQIADLEKKEFAMLAFEHNQMNMVETRINSKFSTVKFRLFNTLINGGVELCCDTLVNGVPYPDINSAGKIQAGIEIINVLSEHYNVYAPCWCDNRESCTDIPELKSQLINLYVSPSDTSLTIR